MPLHTISLSIPAENIVASVPQKLKLMADSAYNTRKFDNEKDYYHEYQISVFGNTKPKAGWDCMRHYEILANGCIPNFENLDQIPENTMVDFPKDIVRRGMELLKKDTVTPEEYTPIISELLDYTRKHLTTESRARHILSKLGKRPEDIRSILVLSGRNDSDCVRDLVIHGFKKLLGEKCVDFLRLPHIYDNYPIENRFQMYGYGFSYAFRVPAQYDYLCDRNNIQERLWRREFDLILFGSVHRGMPYMDTVLDMYRPDEIAFLCGEDMHDCGFFKHGFGDKYHLFVRELGHLLPTPLKE